MITSRRLSRLLVGATMCWGLLAHLAAFEFAEAAGPAPVQVKVVSGSDVPVFGARGTDKWIAEQMAPHGSPIGMDNTEWINVTEEKKEIYRTMQGGRLIEAVAARADGQVLVTVSGLKIGKTPREIKLSDRPGEGTVIQLTDYPRPNNVFLAVRVGEGPTQNPQPAVGKGAVDPAQPQAVYAKVILPIDKPVTSEYPLEPWIAEDLAARGKADFAAMSDWTDPRYPQWVPNTEPGKAHFAAVSDWTRVRETAAHGHFTTIWDGGQLACSGLARYGTRMADGNLTIDFAGFSPGSVDSQGSLPPKPGSRTVVEVRWGNRKCYVALHVGPPPGLDRPRRSGVTLDLGARSTQWPLPDRGESKTLDELLLRVTNRTEDDIWFAQATNFKIIVKDAEGKVLPDLGGQKGEIVPPPLFIKTWAPAIVRFAVTLHRPGDGKSATLTIREPTAVFHEFQDLVPGVYTIQVVYANHEARLGTMVRGIKNHQGVRADPWGRPLDEDTPLWIGNATAKELTVQLAAQPARSVKSTRD